MTRKEIEQKKEILDEILKEEDAAKRLENLQKLARKRSWGKHNKNGKSSDPSRCF